MIFSFGSNVLDAASRLLTPFILLFAIYVLVHGHESPGGGFQGGAILAAAVMLVKLTRGQGGSWGLDRSEALVLACAGALLYAGIGLVSLLFGGAFLDYEALPLPLNGADLRKIGSLGVETGVFLAVVGVFILIFDSLTAWSHEERMEQRETKPEGTAP